jgi:hypothetical protein
LVNNSDREINIGQFKYTLNNKDKTIIKDTIISKGQNFTIDSEEEIDEFELKYPDGSSLYSSNQFKAEKFCKMANNLGGKCNMQKVYEIFDRI